MNTKMLLIATGSIGSIALSGYGLKKLRSFYIKKMFGYEWWKEPSPYPKGYVMSSSRGTL